MADRDPMVEAAELAETLRSTLADLDALIERRAREVAAERASAARDLFADAWKALERAGEGMRQRMMADMKDVPEAHSFLAGVSAARWTDSATSLFFEIWQHRRDRSVGEHG